MTHASTSNGGLPKDNLMDNSKLQELVTLNPVNLKERNGVSHTNSVRSHRMQCYFECSGIEAAAVAGAD